MAVTQTAGGDSCSRMGRTWQHPKNSTCQLAQKEIQAWGRRMQDGWDEKQGIWTRWAQAIDQNILCSGLLEGQIKSRFSQ